MARNPLLLTIIALIKWQGRALPDQRVLLYDVATQTLIRSWPLTQRNVELDELLIREWLAPVAFRILANGSSDLIDQYSLMEELVGSMRHLQSMTEFEAKQASSDLLRSVSEHSGILLPRGTDSDGRELYGFLHRTFAEYLAAYYLVGLWVDNELNLIDYAHDLYWREVLLLMAGHRGTGRRTDGGKFIKAIQELSSSTYESFIHRDLLLANRILGDGVLAAPSDYVGSLLYELLGLWRTTLLSSLREDIEAIMREIGRTGYGPIIARLATDEQMSDEKIVELARVLGKDYFRSKLLEIAGANNPQLSLMATIALALDGQDSEADQFLFAIAQDTTVDQQANVLLMLAKRDSHEVDDLFVQLLRHPNPLTRRRATMMLILRPQRVKLVENLLDEIELETLLDLIEQALVLERVLPDSILAKLDEFMGQSDEAIKTRVAIILANLKDERSIPILEELLASDNPETRLKASEILARDKNPNAIQSLIELAHSENERIRFEAASLVLEHSESLATKILKDLLVAKEEQIRVNAAKILLQSRKEPKIIQMLVKLLESQSSEVSATAFSVLLRYPGQVSARQLEHLLDGPNSQTAILAGILLLQRSDKTAFGILQARLPTMMTCSEPPEGSHYWFTNSPYAIEEDKRSKLRA